MSLARDQCDREDTSKNRHRWWAYNIVTPYTAFLAVPESELGAARDTVMAARERKRKIQLDNDQPAADQSGEAITIEGRAPAISKANLTPGGTLSNGFTQSAPVSARPIPDDEDDEDARHTKRVASRDDDGEAEMMPRPAAALQSGHHGCAGCATGSGSGAASLLLVGITALLVRRRRRR